MWFEHGPPQDPAGGEILEGLVGLFESVAHHPRGDRTAEDQFGHLDQIAVGADVDALHPAFTLDERRQRERQGPADTDREIAATELEAFEPECRGGIGSDEVQTGPHTVADGVGDLIGSDGAIGTAVECELAGIGSGIDGHHRGRRQRPQDLHPEVAETTDADDQCRIARSKDRRGLARRPVGGEAGVGEGREAGQIGVGGHLEHGPLIGQQVVGIPAVDGDPRRPAIGVRRLESGALGRAQPTGDEREAQHRIADLDGGDTRSDLVHPSGVLMAEHQRQRTGHLGAQQVQIGATDTGRGDADHDIGGVLGVRHGAILE